LLIIGTNSAAKLKGIFKIRYLFKAYIRYIRVNTKLSELGTEEKKAKSNLSYLDGIRAVAALYVTLHHASLQYTTTALSGFEKIVVKMLRYGGLSVSLFIVLSGFCLMLSVIKADYHLKGGVILFFRKRIIRILPPYYLAMLFSIILIKTVIGNETGTHWDISLGFGYRDVLTHFLLIHDFFTSQLATINHVFWSIAVEFRIYLFFPFLVFFWRKFGPVFTVCISVLLSYLMYSILVISQSSVPDISLREGVSPFIILFVIGMLAADYSFSKRVKLRWERNIPWGIFAMVSLVGYFYLMSITYSSGAADLSFGYKLKNTLFGISCFCLLIAVSNSSGTKYNWLQKILSLKPLVFLGTFSYSLYLIHAPLLQVLTQYIIGPLDLPVSTSLWILLFLCLTLIPAISFAFFLLCEKPFMSFGHKLRVEQAEHELVAEKA
jgi:peptidoglycan/LPS O-acetylase OafA/YrhL